MESSDLRVFEAVARLGSITGASEELHTVQSNVTARIRLLEEELGVALFRRHSRGVVLTSAGERLLPYAAKVARLLKDAAKIAADNATPRGCLQIGSLETTAGVRLPPILSAYRQKFPEVNLSLTTGTTGHLIEEVLAFRLEGAFVAGPVEHAEIVETPVFIEEMVLVTSPNFRSLAQFVRSSHAINILVLRAGCSYRTRLERLLKETGVASFGQLEFGTIDGIFGCAREGLGITMMPRSVAERAAQNGKLGIHPLPRKDALVPTMFIRRRDAVISAALSRFLECALACASVAAATIRRPKGARSSRKSVEHLID
ncbi:MAG TPA: LysR substrate-binding domain-containing protein [Gemmatimonadales bacterium]|nr:LysR substrate-binding domain-containing protein [Gemmatimonadales bacterium]